MNSYDVVIIGGGSAGLASAKKCYDLGIRKILIIEREPFLGGILNQCIHNGFGLHEFKEQLTGPEYAYRFIKMLEGTTVEVKLNTMVVNISEDRHVTYSNEEDGFKEIIAQTIIITVGCFERSAGSIMLPGDRPSGIYTAGTAQKYLNIEGFLVGKKVFILGSGDIGLIMARRMTLEGAKVLGVAELMPYSNGLNRNIVQCLNDFDIPLYLSHTVTKVIGKEKLEAIEISKVDQTLKPIKGTEKRIDIDTLLLSVGLVPIGDLFRKLNLKMNPKTKGPLVNEHNETSVKGIFTAGNCLHVHDLVDYVSNEARIAAQGAYAFLKGNLHYDNESIKVLPKEFVSYVVPALINYRNIEDKVTLKFRVSSPMQNVNIIIKADGVEIKKVFKLNLIPSEMENIEISKSLLKYDTKEMSIEIRR